MRNQFRTFEGTQRKEYYSWTTYERSGIEIRSDIRSIILSINGWESSYYCPKTSEKGKIDDRSTVSNASGILKWLRYRRWNRVWSIVADQSSRNSIFTDITTLQRFRNGKIIRRIRRRAGNEKLVDSPIKDIL